MALTIPRQPVLEVYAGGWWDVSTEVFQGGQVAINRAGADEQPQATPGTMSATMLNSTGNWSLDNPLGAYADYLDLGSPMRWSLRVVRDTFGTTVANGWGSADSGEAYVLAGAGGTVQASDWQKTGGVGTMSVPTTAAFRFAALATELYQDVEVRCTVTVPITDVTGGGIEPGNVFVRYVDANNYYMARVTVSSAEAVTIGINTPAASLVSPVTVTGLADAVSTKSLRVAIQAEGCTIRAKVYKPGPVGQPNLFEPVAWQVEVHDEQLPGLGGIGVRNGVASGNTNTKPIVFSCDDFDVRLPRYYGWLTRLTPVLKPGNQGQLATLLASGRFMTMSQGTTPVLSPPRRLMQTTTALIAPPKAFWSLESGPLQQSCDPDIGPSQAFDYLQRIGSVVSPTVGFGKGDLGPWVPATVEVGSGDTAVILAGPLPPTVTTVGQWIVAAMVRFNTKNTVSSQPAHLQVSDSVNPDWSLDLDAFNQSVLISGPITIGGGGFEDDLFDGQPHVLWWRLAQSGSQIYANVFIDNRQVINNTSLASWTLRTPTYVALSSGGTERQTVSWGYLAFFDDSGSASDQPTFPLVYLGRVGEAAGIRAQRLCQENGVPFAYLGDLTKTAPMGPQPTLGLLALLQQCADADRAVLLESRGSDGILFVCNNWLYNQTATATVDYSARQVHTLDLSPDDRGVFNDVTAERVYGSSYRTQRLTGPRNAQDPGTATGAIGRRDTRVSVNISSDARLPDIASYEVSRGCDGRSRVPSVGITLTTRSMPGQLQASLMALDVTDRLVLRNLREAQVFRDVDLYVRGYAETFDTVFGHKLTVNALPYEPLRGITFDDPLFRWDSDVSTLATAITGSPGTMSVQATDSVTLWSTAAADYPANVEVSVGDRPGEVIAVSAVSGTTSPQTFTISARSVNGITRDWPVGAKVRLPRRSYWRLS
jgi:hypothetical protein